MSHARLDRVPAACRENPGGSTAYVRSRLLGWWLCVAVVAACSDGNGPKPALTVSGVSPPNGPMAGGTAVTITGTNFPTTVDSVQVGIGLLGNLGRVSSTQLTGTTPVAFGYGNVDVTVFTTGGGNGTCTRCFTYNPPPVTVTSVSPQGGPLEGGTAVTITGANFPFRVDSVRVGTGRLGSLVSGSSSQLMGTTPAASAAGPVDVTVYTTGAGSGTCLDCFTYVVFPRYAVTFLGTGFDSSQAADVNDSGTVVGKVWSAASGWHGRLWPNAGAATDLGVLLPIALNNGGSVLGDLPSSADTTPALWENGSVLALGGLSAVSPGRWYATDINDRREVPVWRGAFFPAYLWQDDSLTALQAPEGSYGLVSLGHMNARGEVAGTRLMEYTFAVVVSTGGMRGVGGRGSHAWALNDAGWVIGWVHDVFNGYGGVLFAVGDLLPFTPAAINNALQIVGEGSIWQDSATASLTALMLDKTWQVSGASAINEKGQIAAYGINTATGARGAIRLDPVAPAPGSAKVRRR